MAKGEIYPIIFKGLKYELGITAISALTGRSRTFLKARLEEGKSMQQAVDATPNDPGFMKNRREEPERGEGWNKKQQRETREEALRSEHGDIISRFLGCRVGPGNA